jgi:integrase
MARLRPGAGRVLGTRLERDRTSTPRPERRRDTRKASAAATSSAATSQARARRQAARALRCQARHRPRPRGPHCRSLARRIPSLARGRVPRARTTASGRSSSSTSRRLGASSGSTSSPTWTSSDAKKRWRDAGYADHTVTKHLRSVRALFNLAPSSCEVHPQESRPRREGAEDPRLGAAGLLRRRRAGGALPRLSFDLHHPDDPQHAPWHAPAWKWLANTGLRRGEALMQRRELGEGGDHLRVLSRKEARTKSGKWREIPLFSRRAGGARRRSTPLLGDRDYVLPRVTPPQGLSKAAAKCIARAGLEGGIHTLRHTFGTHLALDPERAGRELIQVVDGALRRSRPPRNLPARAPRDTPHRARDL